MIIASYLTEGGVTGHIEWREGLLFASGTEVPAEHVLAWDAQQLLAWVNPETRAWAYSLVRAAPVAAVVAPEPQPVVAAPAQGGQPGTRLELLADILATMEGYPAYTARYGTDTDIALDNEVARAAWGTGKKSIEYSAHMKAVEPERVLYFFEILKEKGSGLSFGGVETETYSTFGAMRSGTTKQVVVGPNGVAMDASWDYGQTRRIVEAVCARHGWVLKVVLRPGSAKY
ncbi:MAG: hypothetical protein U1E26_06255 [Coriobacteriia bacterium]|nr:hypothetical protein [Coriobacteriia bacterium]